jgi:hypothetical protein
MYQTLASAIQDVTLNCSDRTTRLKALQKIIEATELALINSATKSGVQKYQINSGQTVINIQQSSYAELLQSYKQIKALFNEMCGIENGSNLMAFRDAESNFNNMSELI